MVYFITGRAGSGKTAFSKVIKLKLKIEGKKFLVYDGDEVRKKIPTGFTNKERHDHIMRIASFASIAEDQGFTVIIALVSPKKIWRQEARAMFRESKLIYMEGGTLWKGTTYEEPDEEEI